MGLSMAGERRVDLLAELSGGLTEFDANRVCAVSVDVTGASGAGIMLLSGDGPLGPLCSTDKVSARIEELQFSLGEGPYIDAYHEDRPVLVPDLANPDASRWLAFSGPALDAGAAAVFGFPLHVGAVRLGVLGLYRDHPGPLTDEQRADALAMADFATRAILAVQAKAPAGRLAAELEANADLRYVVHQASGMVAVQLEVSIEQALVRLRAYAFGNDRPLTEVAEDVVARKLRFDGPDPIP